jgi:hypothetical protein
LDTNIPKTINKLASDFAIHTNDSSGSTLELGKSLINMGVRKIMNLSDWSFNMDTVNYSTGTYVQDYTLPYNVNKVDYVKEWYGHVWYVPKEVKLRKDWTILNSVDSYSTIPTHWFYDEATKKVSLFPIASGVGGTVVVGYTKKIRDLSVADYSTGSVTVSASGTIFTGAGSSWGSMMVGRYLQPFGNNSYLDGYWFEIVSVPSTTAIQVKQIADVALSAGSYQISELIPFPEGYEDIPLWYALDKYYQIKEKPTLAREYERMWKEGVDDLKMRDEKTVVGILEKQSISMVNPNENPWDMYLS